MNGAFYIGATGLDAQQRALDVTANNIANMNTAGFKRSAVRFSELVISPRDAIDLPPVGDRRAFGMVGVRADAEQRIWTPGDLKQTGAQLDIAIDGEGFLEVMGTDGQARYWRGGTLKVNDDGFLATSDGVLLRSMISVPRETTALTIDRDGAITARIGSDGGVEKIGQLEIAVIDGMDGLQPRGAGYYENVGDNAVRIVMPGEEGGGEIVQGAIEGSNVQLSDQMINLLLLQRAYAANAQVVQAGDQIMSIVNNLRR